MFCASDYSDVPLVEEGHQYKTHIALPAASRQAHTFSQNTLPSPYPLFYPTGLDPVYIFTMLPL